MKLNGDFCMALYADVDFARMFSTEDRDDTINVKRKTGWLTMFGGVPVMWFSKIQIEIIL